MIKMYSITERKSMYRIESDRILFREMTAEDTDMVLTWRNSDLVRATFIYQPIITKEEHLSYIENKIKTGNVIQFVMVEKASDKPFGCVYLKDLNKEHSTAEFGIFIGDVNYIGKGFGTEAAITIKKFAFNEMKLHKVKLRVIDTNTRAIKSYQKAGFHVEGTLEDEVIINGKYITLFLMGAINK